MVVERGLACQVVRRGVRTTPGVITGSQGYLHHSHGLSAEALAMSSVRALFKLGG